MSYLDIDTMTFGPSLCLLCGCREGERKCGTFTPLLGFCPCHEPAKSTGRVAVVLLPEPVLSEVERLKRNNQRLAAALLRMAHYAQHLDNCAVYSEPRETPAPTNECDCGLVAMCLSLKAQCAEAGL